MLNLIDRPLIQYAVDEARASGIEKMIFVTSPESEGMLRQYLDTDPAYFYTLQTNPHGLGHAIWSAEHLIEPDKPFAVILPDDVIWNTRKMPCLKQMINSYRTGTLIASKWISYDDVHVHGMLEATPQRSRSRIQVKSITEKPTDWQHDPYAIVGRYILSYNIMRKLTSLVDPVSSRNFGNEDIGLTEAINLAIAEDRERVSGFFFHGHRYDCGSKDGIVQATFALGMERNDIKEKFERFVEDYHDVRGFKLVDSYADYWD